MKLDANFGKAVLKEYEFEKTHDYELLTQACGCLDRIEQCREAIEKDGLFQKDRYGRPIEHDACKVERSQKKLFFIYYKRAWIDLRQARNAKKEAFIDDN